jgi:hypothetical protein
MTVLSDVALNKVKVLDSTMAYREAGDPEAPVTLFCTGTLPPPIYGGISSRWFRLWLTA